MWHCGVDVATRRLSDWTHLQWALRARIRSKRVHSLPWPVSGGDEALPKFSKLLRKGLVTFSFILCSGIRMIKVHSTANTDVCVKSTWCTVQIASESATDRPFSGHSAPRKEPFIEHTSDDP